MSAAAVAAAWATIAGCSRWIGAVTPVPTSSRSVACAMAPRTPHTKGLWPCSDTHGWKWSEIIAVVKPVASPSVASSTSRRASCSSLDNQ